jgi:hypothetical protein
MREPFTDRERSKICAWPVRCSAHSNRLSAQTSHRDDRTSLEGATCSDGCAIGSEELNAYGVLVTDESGHLYVPADHNALPRFEEER